MAKARAEWERLLYEGTAGSAAATQVTHVQKIDFNIEHETFETTDRGTGAAIPKKTEQVVKLIAAITFDIVYHDSDTPTNAMIAVAESGGDIALKIVRYTGGDTMFDGDVTLKYTSPGGLEAGQILSFTATPTQDSGRTWTY